MAKNWTMREAVKEILAGNKDAISDIGRRFPLAANAIASMGNNSGAITIMNALPDHISVRKIESVLKDGVQEIEDDEENITDPVEEKPEKKVEKKTAKPAAKKASKKDEPMNEPEDADDEDDLESMSEVELFKLCKSRKIKALPKKDKAYYINLLKPADEEEDADWDEDEAEEKPTKKAAKKPAAKKASAKKSKDEDEEDDDWDI